MAFAGPEPVRAAYAEAIRERYRFYSFGDAMLVCELPPCPRVSTPPPGTFEVEATDGAARAGVALDGARPRADARLHAGRHEGHGQGASTRGARGRSARRSCSATRTTCTCGRARS